MAKKSRAVLLFLQAFFLGLLVPADTLLIGGLMRRVDFSPRVSVKGVPIRKHTSHESITSLVPLGSVRKVINLALDAVAVPAQDSTDKARLVVVVKAGFNACEVYVAQPTSPVLAFGYLGTKPRDVFDFKSHRRIRRVASCLRLAVSPREVKDNSQQTSVRRKQAGIATNINIRI